LCQWYFTIIKKKFKNFHLRKQPLTMDVFKNTITKNTKYSAWFIFNEL